MNVCMLEVGRYIYVCVCVCVCTRVRACMRAYVRVCVRVCVRACVSEPAHVHIQGGPKKAPYFTLPAKFVIYNILPYVSGGVDSRSGRFF